MSNKKDIAALKKWLNQPDNTKTKIASKLGYKSTMAIHHWIERGKLPGPRRNEILKLIGIKE